MLKISNSTFFNNSFSNTTTTAITTIIIIIHFNIYLPTIIQYLSFPLLHVKPAKTFSIHVTLTFCRY